MNRRHFCGLLTGGAALAAGSSFPVLGAPSFQEASGARTALPVPDSLVPQGLQFVAAPSQGGRSIPWTLNGTYPGPTIRTRPGEAVSIVLENQLPEDTIIHWHGLNVPDTADGHPRLAIAPGETYAYEFEVMDRPGTYWYHPHTHGRTAPQTYSGMAGFFIVEDPAEAELGLPAGDREILLLLQDRRLDDSGHMVYSPFGPDLMFGYMGDTAFANGVPNASLEVQPTTYRFRVLNGSNARIFNLALDDGAPMTLVGTDGGLLAGPQQLNEVMVANAERVDLVLDFSKYPAGTRLSLVSLPFNVPGMMGSMGRGMGMGPRTARRQGEGMEMLEFVVQERHAATEPAGAIAPEFAGLPELPVDADTPQRTFEFNSMMMRHEINGRSFVMDRVDFEVPLGQTEIWRFRNPSGLPHPVHVHAGQFRVLSRSGGRARVMPWEAGMKDTVLLMPGEEVQLAVRFADYRGLYLMHCHNLEHEDAGMMLNFAVV